METEFQPEIPGLGSNPSDFETDIPETNPDTSASTISPPTNPENKISSIKKSSTKTKKGWVRRWDNYAQKPRFSWESVPVREPVDPSIPPEEPPADENLLTLEQLAKKKRQEREARFEQYQKTRPDLYPEITEED